MPELSKPKLDGLVPLRLQPKGARIVLDSLAVMADIGFHDFEIGAPQRLLITIEIWLETVPPADSDEPAFAWDYDHLRATVQELVKARRYNLQETLAHAIYDRIAAMRGVGALRITTSKPDIYPDAKGVGVQIASFSSVGGID